MGACCSGMRRRRRMASSARDRAGRSMARGTATETLSTELMVGGRAGCDQPPPGASAAPERGAEPAVEQAYTPKRTDRRTKLPAGAPGARATMPKGPKGPRESGAVSYTHLRAHETDSY